MDWNDTDNDKEWLLLIAEGDENAFRSLFDKYTSLLLPYVTRFVNSEAIAEEIVQEVFIRIWMHRDQLHEVKIPKAWILRIAANECYAFLRRRELERKTQKLLERKQETATYHNPHYKELQDAIEEAVRMMPEKRRRIYQLSRAEGLKPSEIAERLDLSVATVKNTIGTALEFIRQHLIKKGLFIWACFVLLNMHK